MGAGSRLEEKERGAGNWNSARVRETQRHRGSNCGDRRKDADGDHGNRAERGSRPFNFSFNATSNQVKRHDFGEEKGEASSNFEYSSTAERTTRLSNFHILSRGTEICQSEIRAAERGEENKSRNGYKTKGSNFSMVANDF